MKTLNYSKKVLEFLEKDRETQAILSNQDNALKELLSLLEKSIKFILPERGEILDSYSAKEGNLNKFKKEWVDLMFLPYDIVAFEIPFTYDSSEAVEQIDGLHKQVQSERRVALCWNPKSDDSDVQKINEIIKKFDVFNKGIDYKVGEDNSPDGFCMVVFFYDDAEKKWCFTPAGAFLPYDLNLESEIDGALYGRAINLFPFYVELLYNFYHFDSKRLLNQIWLDINHELWSVLQVCCVLNCENIKTRTIEPPAKLQKNRLRKGLKPLDSYRILTIKASGTVYENMYSTTSESGKGGSKRTHLRRGHLRRLPNKVVWVRSAIIGANNVGKVEKEYHIKA